MTLLAVEDLAVTIDTPRGPAPILEDVGFTLERTPEFGQNVVALRKVWDEEVQPLFLNRFDANVIGGWGNFPAFAFRKVSDFIRGIFKNIVGELRSTQNKKT